LGSLVLFQLRLSVDPEDMSDHVLVDLRDLAATGRNHLDQTESDEQCQAHLPVKVEGSAIGDHCKYRQSTITNHDSFGREGFAEHRLQQERFDHYRDIERYGEANQDDSGDQRVGIEIEHVIAPWKEKVLLIQKSYMCFNYSKLQFNWRK